MLRVLAASHQPWLMIALCRDMPMTYHTTMLVLIVVGLFCTAYLTVPLVLNFRKHSNESKVSGVFAAHCPDSYAV